MQRNAFDGMLSAGSCAEGVPIHRVVGRYAFCRQGENLRKVSSIKNDKPINGDGQGNRHSLQARRVPSETDIGSLNPRPSPSLKIAVLLRENAHTTRPEILLDTPSCPGTAPGSEVPRVATTPTRHS